MVDLDQAVSSLVCLRIIRVRKSYGKEGEG